MKGTSQVDFPLRAGRYIQQPTGYKAFLPEPLPPVPPLTCDGELQTPLSVADRDIGRLDALATLLPSPNLFVAMQVRHEAALSSQIEGTQSTLEDVLAFEARAARDNTPKDVAEFVNCVQAMNHGLARPPGLPLSLRLLREIHKELMQGVRGGENSRGEFRTSQNWIGGRGSTLRNATFIPPPAHAVTPALGALERFLHEALGQVPLLVGCAPAHAQFETIHPFPDGNGRVGRLPIPLMLCEDGALTRPLFYLWLYLKARRAAYCDRLAAIRLHGHWVPWVAFFLRGVSSTARAAAQTARDIVSMRDTHRAPVPRNAKALALLEQLMQQPALSIRRAAQGLGCTAPTAARLVSDFEARGWLRELTGYGCNRQWRYQPCVDLFQRDAPDTLVDSAAASAMTTASAAPSPGSPHAHPRLAQPQRCLPCRSVGAPRVLRPPPAGHRFGAATGNLLVQGDNLDAPKALPPVCRAQVQCIFIDLPCSTKNASGHYDDNLEHSQSLNMKSLRLHHLREEGRKERAWMNLSQQIAATLDCSRRSAP